LFGETTGGSSGAPVEYTMPWSKARVTVPAWQMVDAAGRPIEGHGVAPDEPVAATLDDVAAGRDPVFARAAAWAAGH
jgi:C-terminal processing protease CtpA/Prc